MVIVDDTIRHEMMMQLGYSSQCNLCSPKFVVLVCKNLMVVHVSGSCLIDGS